MNERWLVPALRWFEICLAPLWALHWRLRVRPPPHPPPPDAPLLLVANHIGWWDGFALLALRGRLRPQAPHYTVMLARELRRQPIFRWLGALPVAPESPASVRRLLRTLAVLRQRSPRLTLAYFPQGRIWPSYRRPLGFRRGLDAVARALAPCWIVPCALHAEPLTERRPTLFVLADRPLYADARGIHPAVVEARVTALLDGLQRFLAEVGEDAARRWPQLAGELGDDGR